MSRTRFRALALAGVWTVLILNPALAEDRPPTASIAPPKIDSRLIIPKRSSPSPGAPGSSSGWWLGSAGIVAALAVFGGISLALKKFAPAGDTGPLQVVGRTALSAKQSVYLLRVGDRVLILGTGAQGPPSILGEVTDPVERARLAPRRPSRTGTAAASSTRSASVFDQQIGDDE